MWRHLREVEDLLGDREAFDKETAAEFLEQLSAADRLRAEDEEQPVEQVLTERYLELKRRLFDERFARLLSGEDEFSPEVLEMLTRDDADARRTLERLDNDILWSRLQGLNKRLQDELEKEERALRDARLRLADSEARLGEQVDVELREAHWQSFAETLSGELGRRFRTAVEAAQKRTGVEHGIPFERAIESAGFLRTAAAGASPRTIAVFLAFVLAGIVVAALGQEAAALWVGLSGVLGSMVESWTRAHAWMKQQVEAFDAFDARLRARQDERREALIERAQAGATHQARVQQVAELESKVEAYRRKIGLTAGHPTLLDFIANRLEEGGYAQRLGLLHQVQQDIRQLTEGLLSEALCVRDGAVGRRTEIENVLFPRGLPRVVLFIDDLDRCPPTRVVEVLEAAQLLVKTRLFVVVMAMDVRYITKALEKAYEGVLDRRGAPSGLDYIEKIVQIPYRIRPISAEAMPGYLRSQMQLKVEELEPAQSGGGLEQAGPRSFVSAPGEATVRIDETIPQGVLAFDQHELELIRDAALAVGIGPRATKRLVNVMKLIKIIWYRGGEDEIPVDIRRTVVFFLSLSARYAEIMRRVLLAMEETVADPDHAGNRKRLPNFLIQIEKDWSGVEGRHSEWTFLRAAAKNPALLPQTMTLAQLGSRNIELIRSFSFVGEVDLPPDPSTHQVAVQLQEPVRIRQDAATKKT
jgi:hypothetical protein